MSRWVLPVLLLGAVAAVVVLVPQANTKRNVGFPAPDFRLPDLQGRPFRLADQRGKVVFLNLWATWCPPCRDEMPSMERLHRRLAGRDFVVVAVSEDDDEAAVRAFANDLRLSFPVLLDREGKLPGRYGVTGYPETFLIDRQGEVVDHIIGPAEWDSPEAIEHILRLIEAQPPSDAD